MCNIHCIPESIVYDICIPESEGDSMQAPFANLADILPGLKLCKLVSHRLFLPPCLLFLLLFFARACFLHSPIS